MNFKNLFQLALHHSLPNKANRKEWWSAHIIALSISLILGVFPLIVWETVEFLALVGIFPKDIAKHVSIIVELVLMVVIAIPILYTYMIVSIKRLHDLGYSGWWWLVNLLIVPIPFFILYIGFAKSKEK